VSIVTLKLELAITDFHCISVDLELWGVSKIIQVSLFAKSIIDSNSVF
jgi:hypothetical protein